MDTDSDADLEKLITNVLLNIHKYTQSVGYDGEGRTVDFEYRAIVDEIS